MRALHGSGALALQIHCFRIAFAMGRALEPCIFCRLTWAVTSSSDTILTMS
jgi:hypothetical protein